MGVFDILTRRKSQYFITKIEDATVRHFDVSLNEEHVRSSELTKFPVENGSIVNDHLIIQPKGLVVEGIISETPVALLGGFLFGDGDIDLSKSWKDLESLWSNGAILTISTGLEVYKNMVCTDLVVPRDATTGHALRIKATYQEWRVVNTEVVSDPLFAADRAKALAAATKELGKVVPGSSTAADKGSSSLAKKLFN